MLRATMTVVMKDGSRYSANHVATTRREGGFESDMTFLCSGVMIVKSAQDVDRIEYRASGAVHCEACDQRIDTAADYPPLPTG